MFDTYRRETPTLASRSALLKVINGHLVEVSITRTSGIIESGYHYGYSVSFDSTKNLCGENVEVMDLTGIGGTTPFAQFSYGGEKKTGENTKDHILRILTAESEAPTPLRAFQLKAAPYIIAISADHAKNGLKCMKKTRTPL